MIKRLKSDIERIEEEILKIKSQIEEAKYRKDSLEYRKEIKQIHLIEEDLEEIRNCLRTKDSKAQDFENKIRYLYSANYYIDLIEQRKQLIEKKTMLQTIIKERSELEEEYQNCLLYLKGLLEEKGNNLDETYKNLSLKKETLENEVLQINNNIAKTNTERDRIKAEIAVLESEIKKVQKEIKQITQYFLSKDAAIMFEPKEFLKKMKEREEILLGEKNQALEERTKLQNALEDNKIRESNIREHLARLEEKKKNFENSIESYNNKLADLKRQALVYEVEGNIYEDSFREKLKNKRNTTSNSLTREINRYHDIKKKKLLLEDYDYYIPDYEIKKVYDFLVENDVNCLPGTLWLKYHPEEKRKKLISLNPLIQYSIVVEQSEMERVKTLSGKILELVEEYPVVLIVNSSKGIKMESESTETKQVEGIDPIGLLDIYVVRTKNSELAVNEKAFDEYVISIDDNLQATELNISKYKEDEERINKLIVRIEEFITQYPQSYIKELSESLEQLNKDINSHNEKLIKLAAQNNRIEIDLKLVNENIEQKDKEIEENKSYIERLTRYIELNLLDKEHKMNMEELRGQEKLIENKKLELENKMEKLKEDISLIKEQIKMNEENRKKNRIRLSEVKTFLRIDKMSIKVEGTADEIEARIKGLERKISGEQVQLIKESISMIEKNIDSCINNIHRNGFDERDLETTVTERISYDEIQENEKQLKQLREEIGVLKTKESKLVSERDKLTGSTQHMAKSIFSMYGKPPCEFDDISVIDIEMYNEQINDFERKCKKNEAKLAALKVRKGKIEETLISLSAIIDSSAMGEEGRQKVDFNEYGNLEDGTSIWDIMKMSVEEIAVLKNREYRKYNASVEKLNTARNVVMENYEQLYSDREWEDNEVIKRILSNIMSENIFNYEYIKEIYEGISLTVENMKRATELQLAECLKNKDEIVERSYRRAESVYDELKMVDGFSKIRIGNVNVKTVEIQMPTLNPETGKASMSQYIDNCISEIEKMKENRTYDPAKIDEEIARMMSPVRLFDAVVNLNEIVIKVYKPESNIELSRHIPWETVINWSGGEKLAGFFAMFISIISYLRYKKTNWHGSSKVIWIDNPFGQANAGHLLNYIFELAKATKTQMICLTGLQEVNIYAQFDVVYSLVHRMLVSNTSVIRSSLVKSDQSIETAFYKVEHQQMRFI